MDTKPVKPSVDKASLATGVGMLLVGTVSMAAIIFALYDHGAGGDIAYRLGLPGTLLASAVAQLLILIGGWLIWRAVPE